MAEAQERPQDADALSVNGEYEQITSDEVDRVIASLEELMAQTASENIRAYLEEAADQIFELVYGGDADVVSEEPLEHDQAA